MDQKERVFIHNVLVAGPTKSGKSLFVDTFLEGPPREVPTLYVPTMDGRFLSKTVNIDNRPVTINICDLSGEPYYSLINHSNGRCFPTTAAAILVYDVTDAASFEKMEDVLKLYKPYGIGQKHIPTVLVGNKVDLEDERKISFETGKEFADSEGFTLIEASAQTGENVEYAFIYLACMTLKRMGINK